MLTRSRPKSHRGAPRTAPSRIRRSRRQQLGLESLEGRQLLSLSGEFTVKDDSVAVFGTTNASSSNGMSVAVWTRAYSDTDHDIFAQLYAANGAPIGGQVPVETGVLDDFDPSVAMDATGDFVVVWSQRAAGSTPDIVARQFDSKGIAVGNRISVANTGAPEDSADVAMDRNGNFVVVYVENHFPTSDVVARRFSSTGTPLGTVNTESGPAFPGYTDLSP